MITFLTHQYVPLRVMDGLSSKYNLIQIPTVTTTATHTNTKIDLPELHRINSGGNP